MPRDDEDREVEVTATVAGRSDADADADVATPVRPHVLEVTQTITGLKVAEVAQETCGAAAPRFMHVAWGGSQSWSEVVLVLGRLFMPLVVGCMLVIL